MKNILSDNKRKTLFKSARKKLGLTQAAMSEKLHISEREYGNVERGRSGLSAATLLHFLMLLSDEAKLSFLSEVEHELLEQEEHEEDEESKQEKNLQHKNQ